MLHDVGDLHVNEASRKAMLWLHLHVNHQHHVTRPISSGEYIVTLQSISTCGS